MFSTCWGGTEQGGKDWFRNHLIKLDVHKTTDEMGPAGVLLKEIADVIARMLSINFERSWDSAMSLLTVKDINVTPILMKKKKGCLGSYKLCQLPSVSSVTGSISKMKTTDVVYFQFSQITNSTPVLRLGGWLKQVNYKGVDWLPHLVRLRYWSKI